MLQFVFFFIMQGKLALKLKQEFLQDCTKLNWGPHIIKKSYMLNKGTLFFLQMPGNEWQCITIPHAEFSEFDHLWHQRPIRLSGTFRFERWRIIFCHSSASQYCLLHADIGLNKPLSASERNFYFFYFVRGTSCGIKSIPYQWLSILCNL